MQFILRRSLLVQNAMTYRRQYSVMRKPDLEVDNLVIGGGVVGLAVAERLARTRSPESTILLERNGMIGEEISARNSEVIHAGLYYPEDSLKTKLCIRGKNMLYDLLQNTNIPYKKLGKWVVSENEDQTSYIKSLHEKSQRIGVPTFFMTADEARKEEPELFAHSVLVSPTTGIIDSHSYMEYLESTFTSSGGDIALGSEVRSIRQASLTGGYLVEVATPPTSDTPTLVLAKHVFNSAGLNADKVANMLMPNRYKLHYAKGQYFGYRKKSPFSRLIYPCPEKNLAGLGTHLTLDMAGRCKFGPDVLYIDNSNDYSVADDDKKLDQFVNAVKKYYPNVDKSSLYPDYAGIRPKLAGPGAPFQDFIIREEADFRNFYNLIGIESPGLTSSLAIAEYAVDLMEK
ncbi:FAD dependent oxidoreductase [Umbelopsis sp. PMI_123]|nr:FAD dependent oxidoreductase [Umbelopsis sp. PMI_123]